MRAVVVTVTVLVVLEAVVMAGVAAGAARGAVNSTAPGDDKEDQVVWAKCATHATPACLRTTVARLVDWLSADTHLQLLPGVMVSSDRARALQLQTSGELENKVVSYLRSLTLSVRPLDLGFALNTTGFLDTVTGRRKDGGGAGIAALGMVMGGGMLAMMMMGVAAMAGKAMMTAVTALMLGLMSAMKGGGGGGDGGKHTYEIIASHGHGSHDSHGW